MEIIRLFNNEYTLTCKDMKLNNIIRVLAHINAFGFAENLFKYKFLDYISDYIKNILITDSEVTNNVNQKLSTEKERFFFKQISKYIFKSLNKHKDTTFMKSSKALFMALLDTINYLGTLSIEERVTIIIETGLDYDSLHSKILMFYIVDQSSKLENSNINVKSFKKIIQVKNKEKMEYEKKLEEFFKTEIAK